LWGLLTKRKKSYVNISFHRGDVPLANAEPEKLGSKTKARE